MQLGNDTAVTSTQLLLVISNQGQ